MSLAVHQTWLYITTIVLVVCSVLMIVFRQHLPWVFKYNKSFLSLFGVEPDHSTWIQYLVSWLIATCLATVMLTLIINITETIILLSGLGGILLDPAIVPLAIGGIIIAILLISVALFPILVMPLAPPSALGVILLLHQYGIPPPYDFSYMPALLSVFIYFGALAVGFVGAFLALYLLIRTYLAGPLLQRLQQTEGTSSETQNTDVLS